MPLTFNGIGTHYYFPKNRFARTGECRSCRQRMRLESYDTGLYFVVLYIPVVPLGRRQVLDQCPHCSAHQVLPLKKYEAARDEAVNRALQDLASRPDDPGASLALLQTLTTFNQMEDAWELATAMEAQFDAIANIQFLLAAWFEQHEQAEASERCLERAWRLEPERLEFRRAMALVLGERGEMDQAARLADSFLPETEHFDRGLFQQLAHYAVNNTQYKPAYEFLKSANPDGTLDQNPSWRMLAEICEEALGQKESILKPVKKGWKKLLGK